MDTRIHRNTSSEQLTTFLRRTMRSRQDVLFNFGSRKSCCTRKICVDILYRNEVMPINAKTSQFKTQYKGDISHAFETAKINVFYPTVCKTLDVPLQNELLCWTLNLGYIYFMQTFIPLCVTPNCGLHYSNFVSSTSKVGQGEWPVISGQMWHMSDYELVFPNSIWLLLLVTINLCKLLCHSVWLLKAGVNRITYWSQGVASLPHKCQPPSPPLDNIRLWWLSGG